MCQVSPRPPLPSPERPGEYRFPYELSATLFGFTTEIGLSFRDVEDLLAQRGMRVSYENHPTMAVLVTTSRKFLIPIESA
jgi:hypothetical protein